MVVGSFQCRRPPRLPVPRRTTAHQLVFLSFCGHNLVSEQRTYSSALDSGPGRGCVCLGCCGFMQMLVISVCDWISLLRLPQITTDLWWLTATESYPLTVLEVSPKSRGRLGHDPPEGTQGKSVLAFPFQWLQASPGSSHRCLGLHTASFPVSESKSPSPFS